MANPERGQVAMRVGDQTYRMQLSWNAIACLKRQTGMGLKGVTEAFQAQGDDPDPELISSVIWASMQDHHPDMTVEQAGGLFPAGGLEEVISKVQELFAAAFPRSMVEANGTANPRKAATKK